MRLVKAFVAVSIMSMLAMGCDKVVSLLFQPFESPLNVDVNINALTASANEQTMGQTNVAYNLDQVIKDNTGGKFGVPDVSSVTINQIAIALNNADAQNNLSNFEYVKIDVSTNGGSTAATFGPFTMPTTTSSSASFTVTGSPEILPYLQGSNVSFRMYGKVKNATTKTLNARVSATLYIDK